MPDARFATADRPLKVTKKGAAGAGGNAVLRWAPTVVGGGDGGALKKKFTAR